MFPSIIFSNDIKVTENSTCKFTGRKSYVKRRAKEIIYNNKNISKLIIKKITAMNLKIAIVYIIIYTLESCKSLECSTIAA